MPTTRQLLSCEALTSKAKQACESHAAPCTPPTAPLYVKVGHYLLVQRTCGGLKLVVGAGRDGLGAPQEPSIPRDLYWLFSKNFWSSLDGSLTGLARQRSSFVTLRSTWLAVLQVIEGWMPEPEKQDYCVGEEERSRQVLLAQLASCFMLLSTY